MAVIASLALCSCSSQKTSNNDAGLDAGLGQDAESGNGMCDPEGCNASCLDVQGKPGVCNEDDQCKCVDPSGADGDTDADIDADADADSDMCGDFGGETECNDYLDCGNAPWPCSCPKLRDDEITSYCYTTCSDLEPCELEDQQCVVPAGATRGVCLRSGYIESDSIHGHFINEGSCPPVEDVPDFGCYAEMTFGSISIYATACYMVEIDTPEMGHRMALQYSGQTATRAYVFQAVIPFELYQTGTLRFSDCIQEGKDCSATILEFHLSGVTVTHSYILGFNLVDDEAGLENWIEFTEAPTRRGQSVAGKMKFFMVEYRAEIDAGESHGCNDDAGASLFTPPWGAIRGPLP